MRTFHTFSVKNIVEFKDKLLQWSSQFYEITWLDSNEYPQKNYGDFDILLAVDAFTLLKTDTFEAFEKLNEYQQTTKDWIFGYLTYDLKNSVEQLSSSNKDVLQFPELFFFQPKKIIQITGTKVTFQYLNFVSDEIEIDIKNIQQEVLFNEVATKFETPKIRLRLTKNQYKERVKKMKSYISYGKIYEANFCQEFYAENTRINPLYTYKALNKISKPPMACFFRNEDVYALCASPERYIKKEKQTIISQPIKGTAKRSKIKSEDLKLAQTLSKTEKERSENIMIVDLVRNDLSKTAKKGSVKVNELCKVYTFPQVHQMISTVTSTLSENFTPVEVLKTTFPMGSMTGAPKISAMQIIEELEVSKRGLYSGCIGYFSPVGDFDFNVVIRSILYNETKQYISFSVGSAITHKSDINNEYEECLLKAKAMREALS